MDCENHLEKPDLKNRKNKKKSVKLPHVNKKPLARKRIVVQTPFSHFKIRAEKFHAAKRLAFLLHFMFRRDQNHYSILTSKIMKICDQIFKKRQCHNRIHCKKSPIIAGWEAEAAINKDYSISNLITWPRLTGRGHASAARATWYETITTEHVIRLST